MKKVTAKLDGHVVDGFFDDPLQVRKSIRELNFLAPNPSGVGGLAWRCDVPISAEIVEKLEKVWGFKIEPQRAEIRYTLQSAEEISRKRGIICHSDLGVSQYTAVVYLSRPNDCKGGTAFFEHKPSKSKIHSPFNKEIDFRAKQDWKEYYCSDMKFNRMVTYRSDIFHGIKRPLFGKDIKSARMIQSIRFNKA